MSFWNPEKDQALLADEVRNFGLFDKKGRELGASYRAWEYVLTAEDFESYRFGGVDGVTEVARLGLEGVVVGQTIYCFHPCSLRAGEAYGAIAGRSRFLTREALEKHATKYFRNAEKNAAKIAAKAVRS